MAEITEPPLSGPTSSSSNGGQPPADQPAAVAPLKAPTTVSATTTSKQKPFTPPRQKYALPLPVRTFPLPTFYPSNPVSLFHLAFAWLGQVLLAPPPPEPATVHKGVWSSATRSVQVTDPKSMKDLWCQGFYGKGSLSRSEPNWLNREKARRDLLGNATSEQRTNKRREERADTKWERGRTELEAIEQRRREEEAEAEAQAKAVAEPRTSLANGHVVLPAQQLPSPPPPRALFKAPTGPLELLTLPNSEADLREAIAAAKTAAASVDGPHLNGSVSAPSSTEIQTKSLKSHVNGSAASLQDMVINGVDKVNGVNEEQDGANGSATTESSMCEKTKSYGGLGNGASSSSSPTSPTTIEPLKRQKSVRFSPTVESTTFLHSDPPSPNHPSLALPSRRTVATAANGHSSPSTGNGSAESTSPVPPTTAAVAAQQAVADDVQNKEHLQLSAEEAFFLAYAVGALRVVDPETQEAMTKQRLFTLCRQYSHFPPASSTSSLSTDDPFLTHYAVYHHFRSLGWVPRHGIKFGVDWMLYGKGPALDHAEFGVMVVPSYADPWWKAHGRKLPAAKPWHWLHSVNRVLSTVFKSLVLVYVDIPPPMTSEGEDAEDVDISALLARYRIREVMVRRWSSNRNRD